MKLNVKIDWDWLGVGRPSNRGFYGLRLHMETGLLELVSTDHPERFCAHFSLRKSETRGDIERKIMENTRLFEPLLLARKKGHEIKAAEIRAQLKANIEQ